MMPNALPLPDAPSLTAARRRARIVRLVLGLLAIGLLATVSAELIVPGRAGAASDDGRGSTIAVVDLSGSTMPNGFRQIRATLRRLAHGRTPVGLVLFSDVAVEVLPPGTPARALAPFARSFHTRPNPIRGAALTPWDRTFIGGTRISPALALAHRMLDAAGGGRAVLLSDLADDPRELGALHASLAGYARDPRVALTAVPLPGATADDRARYRGLDRADAVPATAAAVRGARRAPLPVWPLLVAVAGLALVLAAAELHAKPLAWRTAA